MRFAHARTSNRPKLVVMLISIVAQFRPASVGNLSIRSIAGKISGTFDLTFIRYYNMTAHAYNRFSRILIKIQATKRLYACAVTL